MNLLMTQDEIKVFLHGKDAEKAVETLQKNYRKLPDPVSVQRNREIDITLQYSEKREAKKVKRVIEEWNRHGAPWENKSKG